MVKAINFHFPGNQKHGIIMNIIPQEVVDETIHVTFDDEFLEEFYNLYKQHQIDSAIE